MIIVWIFLQDQSCREQMCSTRNSLSSSYNTAKAVSPAEGTPCGNGRVNIHFCLTTFEK